MQRLPLERPFKSSEFRKSITFLNAISVCLYLPPKRSQRMEHSWNWQIPKSLTKVAAPEERKQKRHRLMERYLVKLFFCRYLSNDLCLFCSVVRFFGICQFQESSPWQAEVQRSWLSSAVILMLSYCVVVLVLSLQPSMQTPWLLKDRVWFYVLHKY